MDEDQDDSDDSLNDDATSSSDSTTTQYGEPVKYKPNNKFTASVSLLVANVNDIRKFAEIKEDDGAPAIVLCEGSNVPVKAATFLWTALESSDGTRIFRRHHNIAGGDRLPADVKIFQLSGDTHSKILRRRG